MPRRPWTFDEFGQSDPGPTTPTPTVPAYDFVAELAPTLWICPRNPAVTHWDPDDDTITAIDNLGSAGGSAPAEGDAPLAWTVNSLRALYLGDGGKALAADFDWPGAGGGAPTWWLGVWDIAPAESTGVLVGVADGTGDRFLGAMQSASSSGATSSGSTGQVYVNGVDKDTGLTRDQLYVAITEAGTRAVVAFNGTTVNNGSNGWRSGYYPGAFALDGSLCELLAGPGTLTPDKIIAAGAALAGIWGIPL